MQLELQPFLRDVEGFLLPLTDAQQGPGKSMDQAFNAAKATLATATELEHPQADFPISLIVDTSNTNIGAVLQHFHCLSWAPLFFFSRKLTSAETHYIFQQRLVGHLGCHSSLPPHLGG